MATVVLVDTAAMRRALRESLMGEPGVRVVGEAGSLDGACAWAGDRVGTAPSRNSAIRERAD
jgi:DNA-binding NarL/FixJ family response regulator